MGLRRTNYLRADFGGVLGERLLANRRNWLAIAPLANPAMTAMFDHTQVPRPGGPYLPWSGELVGKYLISAVQDLRMSHDAQLRRTVAQVADELVRLQAAAGGYLGTYEGGDRIFGSNWDCWNHYHCLLGLLDWYLYNGDQRVLDACCRILDHLAARLGAPGALARVAEPAKNFALAHVVALLHRETGWLGYRALLDAYVAAWANVPGGGNYVAAFQRPATFFSVFGGDARWERLHSVQALAELYRVTNQSQYRVAFENAWHGLRTFDRHVSGGFSSAELATGNPYDPRPIETCGTVAWMALSVDMLRLNGAGAGAALAADTLELATWNAALGAQSPDGRWWTYNTPMGGISTAGMGPIGFPHPVEGSPTFAGERRPSRYDIGWQDRAGASLLSCCAANGPRSLGILSDWAFVEADGAIIVNFYGPCDATLVTSRGNTVGIHQETDFPVSGTVRLRITAARPDPFRVLLRIPGWSTATRVSIGGQRLDSVVAGTYLALDRSRWDCQVIELELDMTPRAVPGGPPPPGADPNSGSGASDRVAIYRGPILLAFDERDNAVRVEEVPPLRASSFTWAVVPGPPSGTGPILVGRTNAGGSDVTLRDFATAGMPSLPRVAAPEIVGKVFQFGRQAGNVLGERVRLMADGRIDGYAHANEARWGWDEGAPVFRSADGRITTRFVWLTFENGRIVLRGRSELPPYFVHELREVDLSGAGKWFQFGRTDGTVLAGRVQLIPGGQLSGYAHPNESRWRVEGDALVLVAADGRPSTRFTSTRSAFGRVDYEGQSLFDPAIRHRLRELDLDVAGKEWQFQRPHPGWISLRLRTDGTIESDHPNESRWGWYRGALAFFNAGGAVTTSFTTVDKTPDGRMRWTGRFVPDPTIEHRLVEWNADLRWLPAPRYISWLPR